MKYLQIEVTDRLEIKSSWPKLLDFFYDKADMLSFNVLYHDQDFEKIKEHLSSSISKDPTPKPKLYESGTTLRLTPDDLVRGFLFSKGYSDWEGFCLEDMSFWEEGIEVMATITHEDYIFIIDSTVNRNFIDSLNLAYQILNVE
jgi:hypothetical protein